MQVLSSFDPGAKQSGTIDVSAADAGCKVLLYNMSIVAIKLNFGDGSTAVLHAGEANWFDLDGNTPTLEWSQFSVLNAQVGPLSQCTVTLYRQDEKIEGNYPFSLVYLLSIGNPIPLSTSASSVVNSGNAAGTNILTGQVSGDGSNAVNITNDAQVTLGDAAHNASVTVTGTASITTVDANTVNCNAVNTSDLIVTDGKLGKSSSGDIIDAGTDNNTYIKSSDGGAIFFQSPNGTTLFGFNPPTQALQYYHAGLHDVLYFNPGAGEMYIQGISATGKILIKKSDGTNLMSIDPNGNVRIAGTITQNTTP